MLVRCRSKEERKNRNPPPEVLKRWANQAQRQRDAEQRRMAPQQHRQQNQRQGNRYARR